MYVEESSGQDFNLADDAGGVQSLMEDLGAQATTAFLVGAYISVSGRQAALQEPGAHLTTQPRLLV